MFPSVGSISMPADVPHFRPAGSSPQLRVTFGAGFGRPSPGMKFPAFAVAAAGAAAVVAVAPVPVLPQAVNRSAAQVLSAGNRNRGVDMAPPRMGGHIIARLNRLQASGFRLQEKHPVTLTTDGRDELNRDKPSSLKPEA